MTFAPQGVYHCRWMMKIVTMKTSVTEQDFNIIFLILDSHDTLDKKDYTKEYVRTFFLYIDFQSRQILSFENEKCSK